MGVGKGKQKLCVRDLTLYLLNGVHIRYTTRLTASDHSMNDTISVFFALTPEYLAEIRTFSYVDLSHATIYS